jgi:hypothetical protein
MKKNKRLKIFPDKGVGKIEINKRANNNREESGKNIIEAESIE